MRFRELIESERQLLSDYGGLAYTPATKHSDGERGSGL